MMRLLFILFFLLAAQVSSAQKAFTGTLKYSIDYSVNGEDNGHTDLTFFLTKEKIAIDFNSDGKTARMVHVVGSNEAIVLTEGVGIKMLIKEEQLDEGVPALEWEKLVRDVLRTDAEAEILDMTCNEVVFSGEIDDTRLCVFNDFSLPVGFLFEGGMASKSRNDKILERAFTTNALFLQGEIYMVESKQKANLELVKMDTKKPAEGKFSTSGYHILDFNKN